MSSFHQQQTFHQDIEPLPHLSGILFSEDELFSTSSFPFTDTQVCVLTTFDEAHSGEVNQKSDGGSLKSDGKEEIGTKRTKRKSLKEKISKIKNHKNNETTLQFGLCRLCHVVYESQQHQSEHIHSPSHLLNEEADRGTNNDILNSEETKFGIILLPATCKDCSKSFSKKREFLTHYRRVHSGLKPYSCIRCEEKFFRRCDLLSHLRSHFGLQTFNCRECDRSFNQRDKLMAHLVNQHQYSDDRLRKFKCEKCRKMFMTKKELENHFKVHTGFKSFQCEDCEKKFTSQYSLQCHLRLHTGIFPYKCDVCDFKTNRKNGLTRHKRIHNGSRPFKCDYCNYSSTTSSGLKRHMNQHTNHKPFQCPYCDYKSNNIENIRKHVKKTKKHVGLKVYPCRLCSYASDVASDFISHMKTEHGIVEEQAAKSSGILRSEVTITKTTDDEDHCDRYFISGQQRAMTSQLVFDDVKAASTINDQMIEVNLINVTSFLQPGNSPLTLIVGGGYHDNNKDRK